MRLLLAEDDTALARVLTAGLRQAAYSVECVTDGPSASAALNSGEFSICILDIGLPGHSGLQVLQQLRRSGNLMPVLVLTARDGPGERVQGLDAGADDYLVKPFDFDELLARLRAIQRRVSGAQASVLQSGALLLDLSSRQVSLADREIALGRREFVLLKMLLENVGRIVTRDRLETELYGWLDPVASNALEVHVHHLRKKLGADTIRTMRGVGYMLVNAEAEQR